jgi:hypothetical protein
MRLIIYVSEYCGSSGDIQRDLRDIREVSKRRNQQAGVTGLLFFHNRHFLQALEGEAADIQTLWQRLQADPRHRDLHTLVDIPIADRNFGQWNMDTLNLDDATLFTSEVLIKLRDAYARNIEISDANFIGLLQDMLNTEGVEEVLNH